MKQLMMKWSKEKIYTIARRNSFMSDKDKLKCETLQKNLFAIADKNLGCDEIKLAMNNLCKGECVTCQMK